MKKRIKSYHTTKVSRHEVMTGNSSSAMTNAPPVTMRRRGIRLVSVKHGAETTQAFPALPPASARAPADATASGPSCEQLQTAIRHCFPVTSTAEGVARSNLMLFIFAFLPSKHRRGRGCAACRHTSECNSRGRLRWSSPGNTAGRDDRAGVFASSLDPQRNILLLRGKTSLS